MNAPGSAQRSGAQNPVIAVGLTLLSVALCGLMCVDGVRLTRFGPPWAALPPTLPPGVLAGPTPTNTGPRPSPTPVLAATLDPLLPTATPALAPAGALLPGAPCASDRVVIEAADPPGGATIVIGRENINVTVAFCLQSQPSARLLIAVVSSAEQPQTVPLGGPVVIQQGDGRFAQGINWGAAQWSADMAGEYRLVAAISVEGAGPILVSSFGGQYTFAAP